LIWLFNKTDFQADCLVLDESSMLSSHSSVRFKGKGKRKDKKTGRWLKPEHGLRRVASRFKRVYEISGTPKSGEYLGLWPQIYCLDQGKRLEPTITEFKARYYYQFGPAPYQIRLRNEKAGKQIRKRLEDICYRVPDSEVRAVLPDIVKRYNYVTLPSNARKIYEEVERDFFYEFEETGEEVTVNNIAIRSGKLHQICQGAIYTDERQVKQLHSEKIDFLDSLVSDLGSNSALIIYSFIHDLERLLSWRKAPVLRSSMPEKEFNKLTDEWNAGKHQIMYGFPRSMSHGLNLQGGGFNIIFFGLPWSLDQYDQVIGRLARSGQRESTVFVHHIVCNDTIETDLMLPRLDEKNRSQQQFLKHFENLKNKVLHRRRG
jgi:hypothetical protein